MIVVFVFVFVAVVDSEGHGRGTGVRAVLVGRSAEKHGGFARAYPCGCRVSRSRAAQGDPSDVRRRRRSDDADAEDPRANAAEDERAGDERVVGVALGDGARVRADDRLADAASGGALDGERDGAGPPRVARGAHLRAVGEVVLLRGGGSGGARGGGGERGGGEVAGAGGGVREVGAVLLVVVERRRRERLGARGRRRRRQRRSRRSRHDHYWHRIATSAGGAVSLVLCDSRFAGAKRVVVVVAARRAAAAAKLASGRGL